MEKKFFLKEISLVDAINILRVLDPKIKREKEIREIVDNGFIHFSLINKIYLLIIMEFLQFLIDKHSKTIVCSFHTLLVMTASKTVQ